MKTIFDIGMYDGADTSYFLSRGYRVVAVEANPELVSDAERKFKTQISAGQLICVNAAISPDGHEAELVLSGQDLGSSSLFGEKVAHKRPVGTVRVPGTSISDLFDLYGTPEYLKVDIEGADRFCVLALTPTTRPNFLSYEVGADAEELLSHAESLGYDRFKIINQCDFRELENQRCLYDRITGRLMLYMGYREPRFVRRGKRFFGQGNSGPLPWESDGSWRPVHVTKQRLQQAREWGLTSGAWYDLHPSISTLGAN